MAEIKFNMAAFRELRSAPGVVADLEARGRRVQAAAQAGGNRGRYRMQSRQGAPRPSGRHRVSVSTDDFEARMDNAKNHTLLGAIDAGR